MSALRLSVSICTFVLVKEVDREPVTALRLCQYLYFCTSKESRLSTCAGMLDNPTVMMIQQLGEKSIQTHRDSADVLRHIIKNVSSRLVCTICTNRRGDETGSDVRYTVRMEDGKSCDVLRQKACLLLITDIC